MVSSYLLNPFEEIRGNTIDEAYYDRRIDFVESVNRKPDQLWYILSVFDCGTLII